MRRFLVDGQPIQNLALCFFSEVPATPPIHWLGALVLSAGNRLVFFPGFTFMSTWLRSSRGHGRPTQQQFTVDHLSLEAHRRDWHFTSPARDHKKGGDTLDLGQGRVLWCNISVQDHTVLRPLQQQTTASAPSPPNDRTRRLDTFNAAIQNAQHLWNALHEETPNHVPEGFLHFAFVIGPKGFQPVIPQSEYFPTGSPYVTPPLSDAGHFPVRSGRITIGGIDLEILSTRLPGRLTVPVAFMSA
jgi:hypothetical protein